MPAWASREAYLANTFPRSRSPVQNPTADSVASCMSLKISRNLTGQVLFSAQVKLVAAKSIPAPVVPKLQSSSFRSAVRRRSRRIYFSTSPPAKLPGNCDGHHIGGFRVWGDQERYGYSIVLGHVIHVERKL